MVFEEVVTSLNKKGIYIVDLTQLKDGKEWSVRLRSKTKGPAFAGTGKTVEKAVKAGLANLKAKMTDRDWAQVTKDQGKPKTKRRTRLK